MSKHSWDPQHQQNAVACADILRALRELRTAAALLVIGADAERDRGLGVAMLREISRAERAAKSIGGARSPQNGRGELLM
jgi:hypothetical protein